MRLNEEFWILLYLNLTEENKTKGIAEIQINILLPQEILIAKRLGYDKKNIYYIKVLESLFSYML